MSVLVRSLYIVLVYNVFCVFMLTVIRQVQYINRPFIGLF